MTLKQRKEQFKEKRNAKNPDKERKAECDESKLEMAKRMLCHAIKQGITFKYVLADYWLTFGSLVHAVREPCGNAVLDTGWARMEVLSDEAGVGMLVNSSRMTNGKLPHKGLDTKFKYILLYLHISYSCLYKLYFTCPIFHKSPKPSFIDSHTIYRDDI